MKLLVQGDDFGFSRALTYGILDTIDHGILTCTGLFVNMPSSEWAAGFIPKYPDTCFGLDFNITSGSCVADPGQIPHLVDDKGSFIRSTVKYEDDLFATEEGRNILWPYEEVMVELEAQYQRFLKLVGHEPEYVHTHSLGRTVPSYAKAVSNIGKKYGIPMAKELRAKFNFADLHKTWTPMGKRPKKEFDPVKQYNADKLGTVLANRDDLLQHEYAALDGHPGYVDASLCAMSTVSIERMRDAEMMLSEDMKQWIRVNKVQLISYRDLKKLL